MLSKSYYQNRNRPSGGGGSDWRGSRGGGSSGGGARSMSNTGGYDNSRKHGSSGHDSSPPPYKRRRDWEPSSGGGGGTVPDYSVYGSGNASRPSYGGSGQHGGASSSSYGSAQSGTQAADQSEYPTQPPMLSFKLFLQQQEDNISDEDAIKRYNDYKLEFKRTQINKFFLDHRDEEWFKTRYHPDENFKRRDEHNQHVLSRLEVFMELLNKGALDDISVEFDKSKEITRLLDSGTPIFLVSTTL
jgi:hypothetical protein